MKQRSLVLPALAAIALITLRRYARGWAATTAEFRAPLPADDLIPQPQITTTHAVTIHAPPRRTAGVATALATTADHSPATQPAAPAQPTVASPLTKQFEETAYYLKDVDFISAGVGWAVGAEGVILHTADGGAHWTRQAVGTTDEFRGVAFANATEGWATSFTTIHDVFGDPDDTSDGGLNWAGQYELAPPTGTTFSTPRLDSVQFLDDRAGWLATDRGEMWFTADGGGRWRLLGAPGFALYGLHLLDAQHGWFVGDGGTILKLAAERWPVQEEVLLPFLKR